MRCEIMLCQLCYIETIYNYILPQIFQPNLDGTLRKNTCNFISVRFILKCQQCFQMILHCICTIHIKVWYAIKTSLVFSTCWKLLSVNFFFLEIVHRLWISLNLRYTWISRVLCEDVSEPVFHFHLSSNTRCTIN